MQEPTDGIHSSDLIAMTEKALDCLSPGWRSFPDYYRQWIKDGLMIEMHKAYQNSPYAREALKE